MTRRQCTGLLIDPVACAVGPVTIDPTDLDAICELLGCDVLGVQPIDAHNVVYVDARGRAPEPLFQIRQRRPRAGRGLVLGTTAKGDTVSATVPIGALWEMIRFPEVEPACC